MARKVVFWFTGMLPMFLLDSSSSAVFVHIHGASESVV